MHGTFTHSHSHVTSHNFLWISLHPSPGTVPRVGAPAPRPLGGHKLMLPLLQPGPVLQ